MPSLRMEEESAGRSTGANSPNSAGEYLATREVLQRPADRTTLLFAGRFPRYGIF